MSFYNHFTMNCFVIISFKSVGFFPKSQEDFEDQARHTIDDLKRNVGVGAFWELIPFFVKFPSLLFFISTLRNHSTFTFQNLTSLNHSILTQFSLNSHSILTQFSLNSLKSKELFLKA